MQGNTTVPKPALRYYGGKWALAPWIISHFPKHLNYLEPCGGGASVLLRKPRVKLETYNDIDGEVVNFFRVLRDAPDQLIAKIRLTPWAREEYLLSFESAEDSIERARRFFYSSWMSLQGGAPEKSSKTWRCYKHANGRYSMPAAEIQQTADSLHCVASRLLGVQIENRDALDVIDRYDTADTLCYFDPPYIRDTRTCPDVYRCEVDEAFHISAAKALHKFTGFVVISGYSHPLYDQLFDGWTRKEKESRANSGCVRVECLWLSPRTVKALSLPRQRTFLSALQGYALDGDRVVDDEAV